MWLLPRPRPYSQVLPQARRARCSACPARQGAQARRLADGPPWEQGAERGRRPPDAHPDQSVRGAGYAEAGRGTPHDARRPPPGRGQVSARRVECRPQGRGRRPQGRARGAEAAARQAGHRQGAGGPQGAGRPVPRRPFAGHRRRSRHHRVRAHPAPGRWRLPRRPWQEGAVRRRLGLGRRRISHR